MTIVLVCLFFGALAGLIGAYGSTWKSMAYLFEDDYEA